MYTDKALKKLEKIKFLISDYKITGSLALSCKGIIHRSINDIDLLVKDVHQVILNCYLNGIKIVELVDYNETNLNTITPLANNTIQHIRFTHAGVNYCIFSDTYDEKYTMFKDFKIASSKKIIDAKIKYLTNLVVKRRLNGSLTVDETDRFIKHSLDITNYANYLYGKKNK